MSFIPVPVAFRQGESVLPSIGRVRPEKNLAAVARVIACVNNHNSFAKYARGLGVPIPPKTIPVLKGGSIPHFVKYPVILKVASGASPGVVCTSRTDLKQALRKVKEDWQVQEFLDGFDFHVIRVSGDVVPSVTKCMPNRTEGVTKEVVVRQVLGTCRTLIGALTSLGLPTFELTVAVRQDTVYVISCRPGYVETH